MGHLRKFTSLLRKTILIGWALAVVWIYIGDLVNFHQNRIWGKQLIPTAYSSTRVKEKDAASFVKDNRISKLLDADFYFDFTSPVQPVSDIPYIELVTTYFHQSDTPVPNLGIQAFSFRGPPSA